MSSVWSGGKRLHSAENEVSLSLPMLPWRIRDVRVLSKLQSTVQMCFIVIIKKQESLGQPFFQNSHCNPLMEATRVLMKYIRPKSSRLEESNRKHQSASHIGIIFHDLFVSTVRGVYAYVYLVTMQNHFLI